MSLPLSTLNALTATGQVIACGAASAARHYAEYARTATSPERAARYLRDAITWQEDAAKLSSRNREHYAADNLGEPRPAVSA